MERKALGLPKDWKTITAWLQLEEILPRTVKESGQSPARKYPDIPMLNSYLSVPPESFWKTIPCNLDGRSGKGKRRVKGKVLKKYMQKCWFKWTWGKRNVAKKALRRVQGKEPVGFTKELPGVEVRNARSAVQHGKWITDTLADWEPKGL